MRQLKIDRLERERVDQVFPLIQLLKPNLSWEDWHTRALAHMAEGDPRTGFLAVEDERRVVLGLFQYTIEEDLDCGRMLRVQNVVALDFLERLQNDIAMFLIQAMDDLAFDQDCRAIEIQMPRSDRLRRNMALVTLLEAHGFRQNQTEFRKRFA